MIARLLVQLPYTLAVPEAEFNIYRQMIDGYAVECYPPLRSADSKNGRYENLTVDGTKAIEADVLRVDFVKETFSRTIEGPLDPPVELIAKVLTDFHLRLRAVTRGAQLARLEFPHCNWHVAYLHDDETEVEETNGHYGGRGGRAFRFAFVACTPKIWDEMAALPVPYEPPVWDTLRLDAAAALPSVGSALVLAAAALEVFIGQVLNGLANHRGFPPDVWAWINDRGNWLKHPSVEEEFDLLLKHFAGHSLKEERDLWEALKNIRTARNSFAHDGIPKIGGETVAPVRAAQLVQRVHEIVDKVREWLPPELHWPAPKVEGRIAFTQVLRAGQEKPKGLGGSDTNA